MQTEKSAEDKSENQTPVGEQLRKNPNHLIKTCPADSGQLSHTFAPRLTSAPAFTAAAQKVSNLTLPPPPFPFTPSLIPSLFFSPAYPPLGLAGPLHFLLYLVLPFYFLPLILQKCYLSPPLPTINKPLPAVFQALGGGKKPPPPCSLFCQKPLSLWGFFFFQTSQVLFPPLIPLIVLPLLVNLLSI